MKSTSSKSGGQKKSAVIRPGTGSGSRPKGGSTMTKTSAPEDKHGLGRKPSGPTLK